MMRELPVVVVSVFLECLGWSAQDVCIACYCHSLIYERTLSVHLLFIVFRTVATVEFFSIFLKKYVFDSLIAVKLQAS